MARHNEMFELSVDDMDVIETAMRSSIASLSQEILDETAETQTDREDTVRRIQELLGRLHDQKVFYRPRTGIYVGG